MAHTVTNPSTSQPSRMPLRELPLDSFIHQNNNNSNSSSSSSPPTSNSNCNSSSSSPFNKSSPSALARKKMRVSASTQSSTNTPPTIKHQSDSTLHSHDKDAIHSKVESGQEGQGGNPVETETEASDADKDELSIHRSNNLLHKGTSPTSQKQRSEGKKAFLEDQDQEEEEKLDLLRGGVGNAGVCGGPISIQDRDANQDESLECSKDEPLPVQDPDPDSTLTIKSLSSSPRRGEDQHQSERREKQKEDSDVNTIQKDGDFVIFRDSEEISDSIMKGGNPFESMTSTALNKGNAQEVVGDDEITDENQKPEWLINILEEKNDSKLESNSKRKEEMNRVQDQASASSPYRKSSKSKSNSDSSSSPNNQHKFKDHGSNLDSDPIQVQKGKGGKFRLGKVEERSEIGKGQSSSSSSSPSTSIIETRAQKKRKVTPKISVQTQ